MKREISNQGWEVDVEDSGKEGGRWGREVQVERGGEVGISYHMKASSYVSA